MEKVKCPVCKEWANYNENPFRPFCSKNCKEKDLGNWATERYRIEKQEQDAGIEGEFEKERGKKGE